MRSRTIRPGFFDDHELARLPYGARLLFIGLWLIADREGRLLDIPRRIAGEVFPWDQSDVEEDVCRWLAELDAIGCIHRYEVSGLACIHIKNFRKHQSIHKDEALSRCPPPPGETQKSPRNRPEIAQGFPGDSPGFPQGFPGDRPEIAQKSPGESLGPSTSTSTSISTFENPPTPLAGGHTPPTDSDARINALADTYPTTAGRQQGIRAICEIVSESANPETALAGLEAHWAAWCEFLGERDAQYRPRLDRFVRSNDWMHAPPEPTRKGKVAEQPAKPDCLWDLNEGVDASTLGLTADEFEARLAAELGSAK
jgi:hypothetical protein